MGLSDIKNRIAKAEADSGRAEGSVTLIHEAAERLIKEPDSPVLNISLDVGYRTLSSFNRAFKDIQGMSPSEYRAK